MARAKPGPRTKFTSLVKNAILEALSLGTSKQEAAEASGISYSCLQNWENIGNKDLKAGKKSAYADFVGEIKARRAASVAFHLNCIKEASLAGRWQASAWWLERLHHERYGKTPDTVINNTATAIAGAGVSSDLMAELAELDTKSDEELLAIVSGVSVTATVKTPAHTPRKRIRRTKKDLQEAAQKLLDAGTPENRLHIEMKITRAAVKRILKELKK